MDWIGLDYRPYAFVDENPCFLGHLLQLRTTDRLTFNVITILMLVLDFYFAIVF